MSFPIPTLIAPQLSSSTPGRSGGVVGTIAAREDIQHRPPSPYIQYRPPSPFSTVYNSYRRCLYSSPQRSGRTAAGSSLNKSRNVSPQRRVVEMQDLQGDLLGATRQFRDVFYPSMGKAAIATITRFHQVLHLSASDQTLLMNALHRCQQFMTHVERLLQHAVERDSPMDRTTVNFAYVRWSEAQELSARIKRVLSNRLSGLQVYVPDKDDGGLNIAGVAHPGALVSRASPRTTRQSTPVARRRLRAHSMPSYQSIASRWSSKWSIGLGGSRATSPNLSTTMWRSAADEHCEDALACMQRELVDALQYSSKKDHCVKLLHNIRSTFDALHAQAVYPEGNHAAFEDAAGEAAFLMWLSTLSPTQLLLIETLLAESQSS